uniref:Uncharacterized protein n=1 Tax=Passalora fulva TaxID=5499 RepID=A0A1P8YXR0_PASFU|nr:hypothetical protein 3 [Fulvia fulva]
MYIPALLTAAFVLLAFASEQATQGEECGECGDHLQNYGGGGGHGGGSGRYNYDSYTGYNFHSSCKDGQTGSWDGHQMRCNEQQWQYHVNGQWHTWSSSSQSYNYQSSDEYGNHNSGSHSSHTANTAGGFYKGSFSVSNQIPLHFDNDQYSIPLNTLYPYDTTCSQIKFPDNDPCEDCEWQIQKVQCQAFSDPQGKKPVGDLFGYNNGCDFGTPTKVFAVLCTVS